MNPPPSTISSGVMPALNGSAASTTFAPDASNTVTTGVPHEQRIATSKDSPDGTCPTAKDWALDVSIS